MKLGRAVEAGLLGTAVMTMLMVAAPLMGLPPMPIGAMLGAFLGIGATLGWAMHFMIGVGLATGYALLFAERLPGAPAVRGMAFSLIPFLVAQVALMPMMGGPVFSGGDVKAIMGSLMGHLVYGAVVGLLYGRQPARRAVTA